MERMNMLAKTCCLVVGMLLLSCTKDNSPANQDMSVRFGTDTDGMAAGTTYRIMAYSTVNGEDRYSLLQTGTYYLKNQDDEALTACSRNSQGEWTDDPQGGLNGANGNFYLVFVSPAVDNNPDGSFSFVPSEGEFRSSTPESKSIGGYGLIRMNNKLLDRRAAIGINFYKLDDPAVDEFKIEELTLDGAGVLGEPIDLFPATRQVDVGEGGDRSIAITLTEEDRQKTNAAGDILYYSTAEKDRVFVASAIYAPKDKVAEILDTKYTYHLLESDYIYMNCRLSQGNRSDIDIRMPLTSEVKELQPQHTYAFNITIKSNYTSVTLDVFDQSSNTWQDGGNDGVAIEKPDFTVKLGTWKIVGDGNDWKLIKVDEQVIG